MKNEGRIGRFVVAGQPTDEEIRALGERGFGMVVNVRLDTELEEPEEPKVRAAGLAYASVPYTHQTLTREHVQRVREAAEAAVGSEVLLH
ncbi:MAG: hypothetical protein KGM44_03545 [bacterium]|nr:hypothetical protein [bacterium]